MPVESRRQHGTVWMRTYRISMCSLARKDREPYAAFDVVVVAASAGGTGPLLRLLENLPSDFPCPIIVVVHLPPASKYVSQLPEILQRRTLLEVKWAENGECLLPGTVYVAPQDRSTLINTVTGRLLVSSTEELSKKTPTADSLFISAAQVFANRTLAVVLSGVLSDGAAGSAMVARAGGRVLAQSAEDAQFCDMPTAALKRSLVGLAFNSISLAHVIVSLVMTPGVAAWFAIGKARVSDATP
jgi:two-component system chemotaxis response regulator CheB